MPGLCRMTAPGRSSTSLVSGSITAAAAAGRVRQGADSPNGTPNDPDDILYGTRLNHFAAFADPDWRDWDWMGAG